MQKLALLVLIFIHMKNRLLFLFPEFYNMSSPSKHVLFVTVPVLSHTALFTALFNLAKKLSGHHDVTFVVPAVRAKQLRGLGSISAEDEERICVVGLNDGQTQEDVHTLSPETLIKSVMTTTKAAETLFRKLPVTGSKDSIVDRDITRPVDFFVGDFIICMNIMDTLLQHGFPIYLFDACPAFVYYNKINVSKNTPRLPDEAFFSDWEAHPDVNVTGVPKSFAEHMIDKQVVYQNISGIVFNSVEELEPDCRRILRAHPLHQKYHIRFVAPLLPAETLIDGKPVMDWMDKHPAGEVIYIAFGSTVVLPRKQIEEISKALSSLRKPFIWALKLEEQKVLPEDLRTNGSATAKATHLILTWAPQLAILRHPATGVFLTHGGWNSCLESMDSGVPIVVWPFLADQYGNAKMVEQLGNGVKINDTSMLFTRIVLADEITAALQKVGDFRNAKKGPYGEKAEEARRVLKNAVAPGGSSDRGLQKLIQDIDGCHAVRKPLSESSGT